MEILNAFEWEVAADLILTAGLLKAALLIAILWPVIRAVPARHAGLRASLWVLGFGSLLFIPVVSWGAPLVEMQVVEFPRGLFEGAGASSPAFWLAVIWAAGAVALLGRFLLHRLRVARLAWAAEPVTGGGIRHLLDEARDRVGVRRPVRIALSPGAPAPLLVGWLRPTVLLAPEAREWPEDRLLAVLCHEMAHVRRGDYLWMVLGEVIRAVYWVNPLVFFGLREARMEQDKACDAAALRTGFGTATYARHLVEVARRVRARPPAPATLSFGRRSDLRERVGALLDRPGEPARGLQGRILAALTSAAVVALSAGILAATNFWICTGA
jgi:beta-lactamase regulating signal transducer with metallopeptidase domain